MTRFEEGDRVDLVFTGDPFTRLRPGDQGTVRRVHSDPWPAIDVAWASGSTLSMLPDSGDRLHKLPPPSATGSSPRPQPDDPTTEN